MAAILQTIQEAGTAATRQYRDDLRRDLSGRFVRGSLAIGTVIVALALANSIDAPSVSKFAVTMARSVLAAASFAALGAITGFLFAIPRAVAEGQGDARGYTDNSNLEKVSDWLTTLIVGITLIQLGRVGDGLSSIADFFADGSPQTNAEAYYLSLILLGFSGGFMLQYLWSRLRFPTLLEAARSLSVVTVAERARLREQVLAVVSDAELPLVDTSSKSKQKEADDEALLAAVDPSATDVELLKATALVLEDGRQHTPEDAPILRALARTLRRAGQYASAVQVYEQAFRANPSDATALNSAGIVLSRDLGDHAAARSAYERAMKADPRFATPMYNIACSYARQYAQSENPEHRRAALERLDHALDHVESGALDKALRRDVKPGGAFHGIAAEAEAIAAKHGVTIDPS